MRGPSFVVGRRKVQASASSANGLRAVLGPEAVALSAIKLASRLPGLQTAGREAAALTRRPSDSSAGR